MKLLNRATFFPFTKRLLAAACCLSLSAGALAAVVEAAKPGSKAAPKLSMSELLKTSAASDWRTPDPESTLYLEMDTGRVVIALAPGFAPLHVANIKALVRENYFDGSAFMRSQDNYVAQWGDPNEEDAAKKRQVKSTLLTKDPELSVKYTAANSGTAFTRLPDVDGYAPQVGHVDGFAAARDPKMHQTWLAHCYASVGVGRGNEVDSGDGTSLYVVNGNAPRHLDRNVTVVGRVLQGMELISSLPRGTGPMGFYETAEQMSTIKAMRVAADVPEAERSKLEVLRTDTPLFKAVVEAQRNRGGEWYKRPAGHIELCNVPLPVRLQK
ncbi:peptidylprolyl isomerase [Undibacterium sp.]|uniref:peptidylprolyl isomerase n=1 Tax=Undibacterium sp. TaxID=1914977 RepID=UPI0025D3C1AD|nr:peptidylprolyl isomerase [Undibacterium sp.]